MASVGIPASVNSALSMLWGIFCRQAWHVWLWNVTLTTCLCGAFAHPGEHVEYRRMAGGGTMQLLRGRITADGNIQCFCERCKGDQKVPNSVFEEHAGSKVGVALSF